MSGISSMMLGSFRPSSQAADGDTTLLLHFDGANLSTTFTDSSTNAYVFQRGTGTNAAQIRTENPKFGTGSLHSTAATGANCAIYLVGVKPTPLNLQTDNFTIEWFADYTGAVGVYGTGQAVFHITVLKGSNKFQIEFSPNGTYTTPNGYVAIDFANSTWNTWRHYAVVKNGTAIAMYANGSALSGTVLSPSTAQGKTAATYFANGNPSSGKGLQATEGIAVGDNWVQSDYGLRRSYMDELRVSTTARYTANFTPTTSAFSS
jgi:hypothetical protein